jgi:DNA modification methylase
MTRRDRRIEAADNLEGLSSLADESATLAYVDPPFNSGRSYEAVLFRDRVKGHQETAFNDKWTWTEETDKNLRQLGDTMSADRATSLTSFIKSLAHHQVAAYLAMMAPRLAHIHRVLSETGSVYVHCDPSASHYLRVLLDQIFGPENFRNEIVWRRTHAHIGSRRYGPIHDSLLFYSKTSKYCWNTLHTEYNPTYLENHFTHEDERGKYQLITCTAPGDRQGTRAHYEWAGKLPPPGRHWAWQREQMEKFDREGRLALSINGIPRLKRYINDGKGVPLQDVWLDIHRLDAHSDERTGYETQKPLKLLERIVAASSNLGDLVVDPFCGSGSFLVAAEQLGRRWAGIDSSLLACSLALGRVRRHVGTKKIELLGFPDTATRARTLRKDEPLTFGVWATGMVCSLPDRDSSSPTLIAGHGQIRQAKQTLNILSWVPLTANTRIDLSRTDVPTGRKLGVVVRADANCQPLRKNIETSFSIPVIEVDLDLLASSESLHSGFVGAVGQLQA